jgi:hypothetical protein
VTAWSGYFEDVTRNIPNYERHKVAQELVSYLNKYIRILQYIIYKKYSHVSIYNASSTIFSSFIYFSRPASTKQPPKQTNMWPMWCIKDLEFKFTDQGGARIISLLRQYTAGGTEPPTNQTWLDIAKAVNAESNDRKSNHRSIYAHYTLYLKPGITPESRQKALDASGMEGAADVTENPPFPNLAQFSQLQQCSGNVIERERLPPLQVRNQGLPSLMPTVEPFGEFGERLTIEPPKNFEENIRKRKRKGKAREGD